MKRGTKIGLGVAAATAAASAAALKWSSRMNDVPLEEGPRAQPAAEPDVDGHAFLEHLGAAIRIDTTSHDDRSKINYEGFSEFRTFLEDTYPLVHEVCTREVISDHSFLYTWQGSNPDLDPVVLMAHIDVVPVEPGTEGDWSHPPFSGEIADGHVWGRGALDDKGPLISTIEGVEHLLRSGFEPQRTVLMTFGHDEEIGGRDGGRAVAETIRSRGVTPWFVVDEGGFVSDDIPMLSAEPVALIKVAEKGYLDVKLTARGQGGHSSMPPSSTAAGAIGEAVHRLQQNQMPTRVGVLKDTFEALAPRIDPKLRSMLTNLRVTGPVVGAMLVKQPQSAALVRTTTAVTIINGGHKSNVLPQEASAVVNFRILPGDSIDAVLAHVRETVGPDVEVEVPDGFQANEPSGFSSIESDAWHVVKTAVDETFTEAITAPWILTAATDSRYYEDFAGDVYGFIPFAVPSEGHGYHGTNERIRVADAERAVSFWCRLIRHAAG